MTQYLDTDEDGFGDDDQPVSVCEVQEGFPLLVEIVMTSIQVHFRVALNHRDDVDNDCDGLVDDDNHPAQFLVRYDGDTHHLLATSQIGCVAASNYILQDGDCDDLLTLSYQH